MVWYGIVSGNTVVTLGTNTVPRRDEYGTDRHLAPKEHESRDVCRGFRV